jgi:hypothetical protein
VDTGGSGGGGQTTEVFTVDGDWDLRWSYDCSPSLRNQFRTVDHCDLFLTVKQMSDCQVSPRIRHQPAPCKGSGTTRRTSEEPLTSLSHLSDDPCDRGE